MERYFLIMIGGAVGSLLRYITGTVIASKWAGRFPLGTFAVNVLGSFLIGALMTFLTQRGLHENWRFLLIVGFLGGYTTFSSFEYETYIATRGSDYFTAGIYVVTSVVLGFVALWLGASILRR